MSLQSYKPTVGLTDYPVKIAGLIDQLDSDFAGIGYVTSVSGTNTITGTLSTLTAYAAGQILRFIPANTNTAATTLNVSSLGAKNVYCGGAACVGGELRQNIPVVVIYDGTQFNIVGPYVGGNLPTGQIKFPATQVPSSDANTLDDYEEGTWTPTITFVTPGNLSVSYSVRVGTYTKIGRLVHCQFSVTTSAFTHTTASGSFQITGLPFTTDSTASNFASGVFSAFQGFTKAGYTQFAPRIDANGSIANVLASGSGVGAATTTASDTPSGGTIGFNGSIVYHV